MTTTDTPSAAGPYTTPGEVFASTEEHYLRHRPGYPPVLLDFLARLAAGRVMDLGSGPGLVARELARRGCEVLAVDPNPRMLEIGRSSAAAGSSFVTLARRCHRTAPEVATASV
jgi:2-polyprenyl-3-methyl-5-hydroxy-6-metoxy-1,4-benzoquinol methylase